jgi:Uma2 family endonuclease
MNTVALKEEKFTYEDYVHFPNDGKQYQIIRGEVYMTPAPVPYHQRVIRKLGRILDEFITTNKLGEVFYAPCDVLLSDEDVVQPDLFFISNEKMSIIKDKYIAGIPDLAIEILSTYTKKLDKLLKKKLYESYGVKEYWVVDIDKKTIEVFSLKGRSYKTIGVYKGNDIVQSDLINGLKFNLKEIF